MTMAAPIRSCLTRQIQSIARDIRVASNGQICISHQRESVRSKFCVLSLNSLNCIQNRNIVSSPHATSRHYGETSVTKTVSLSFLPQTSVLYIPSREKGHSKWQNIAGRKKAQDSLKSTQTSRTLVLIGSAIKTGGSTDPKYNSSLAAAIEVAKKANIPKATVDGYIKKMAEKSKTCSDYQLLMQGPHGSYFVVQAYTKTMNQMSMDLSKIIKKLPIKITESGQLPMIFDFKGEIIIEKPEGKDLEEIAITCDAEEFVEEKDEDGKVNVKFICDGDSIMSVKKNLEAEGFEIQGFETTYMPKMPLNLTDEEMEDVNLMAEKLEEYEDLSNYYINV